MNPSTVTLRRYGTALRAGTAGLMAALALAACSSTSSSANSATSPSASASSTPQAAATTDSGATAKVSANNASVSEIAAALDAAGVPNASRWAREVEEYRPYPADDATWSKLRAELAKYNPGSDVVDRIVSALSLP